MVRKLASIVCLVQGSCQGMMGNKDIIECKLSQRVHEEERLQKGFFFHSSLWWQHCVVPTMHSLFQTGAPRGLQAHFISFFSLLGSHYSLHTVYFFSWTKQCVVLMWFFQRRQRARLLCISLHRRQRWQESKQQAGREVNKVKQNQGWVRVRDSEKDWDKTGDCRMSTSWWDCWRIFSLCASTNEIWALIILTLFGAYDRGWHRLNHVYVPVLASVSTLRDTFYPITDCTCCWCTWVYSYKK